MRFQPDMKYREALSEKEAALRFQLSSKLDEAYLRRLKALYQHILTNCYSKKKYTITQARACEQAYMENDYQLKKLQTFVEDNIFGEMKGYSECSEGKVVDSLKSVREKDDYFIKCHQAYMQKLDDLLPELKSRIDRYFN